jgi:hypothetical protein
VADQGTFVSPARFERRCGEGEAHEDVTEMHAGRAVGAYGGSVEESPLSAPGAATRRRVAAYTLGCGPRS